MVKMVHIYVPDEICIINLVPTPVRERHFRFPFACPEIMLLKNFLDVRRADWSEMAIFPEQKPSMHSLHSSFQKAVSESDNRLLTS
jgi:hypothetical protein